MKNYIYPVALAAMLLSAASCKKTDIDVPVIPDDQKEKISFSLSDGTTGTKAGFGGSATFIAMRMQSDDKGSSATKYTRTVATAEVDRTRTDASYSTITFTGQYQRYWDDAHGRTSKLSVFAVAIPNQATDPSNTLENKLYKGDATKDWGTISTNTIDWSVTTTAQTKDSSPENTAAVESGTIDKEDLVYSNNIQSGGKDGIYRWDYAQNKHLPEKTGLTTHHNGQMLFFQQGMTDETAAATPITDAPGHFDKGHLVFNHSLSRISVTLVEGTGFNKDVTTDFDFADGTNITLLDMNIKGTLDLPTGTWTIPDKANGGIGNITKMAPTGSGQYSAEDSNYPKSQYYNLTAQMLPDYEFNDGNTTNVMQFTIDGNTYFITKDMLYDALYKIEGNRLAEYGYDAVNHKFTMKQGKNYNFTLVVNKKQIEAITATLKAWDDVNAQFAQDNTHITISTSSTGSEHNDELNLFKMEQDLGRIYTDDSYFSSAQGFANIRGNYKSSGVADLREMKKNDNSSYDPKEWYAYGWYYKDNQTAYHLRTLNNLAADEGGTTAAKDENVKNNGSSQSYFSMQHGEQSTQDYHWGAPMTTTANLQYHLTQGYSSSIHAGFVAPKNGTSNPINITELHMMSNINIILKTTTTSNKINLRTGEGTLGDPYKYATVKLTKLYSEADVDMGAGLVTPKTIVGEQQITRPTTYFVQTGSPAEDDVTTTQPFTWSVVPQELVRDASNMVGITITTPDNNEYYIIADLSTIVPTSVGSQTGQMHNTTDPIIRWYPNHSYTYTFTLTKKGIEAITCTLADWVTVTGEDTPVDLEK